MYHKDDSHKQNCSKSCNLNDQKQLIYFNYFRMVKRCYAHHRPAKEMQCLTPRVLMRFSRGLTWCGKAGHPWQHYNVLVSGMCMLPVQTTFYSAIWNLTSCPSSLSAQVPYWDVFNTSIGKHFSKVKAELHGSSTPGNIKIFYQRLYYKWRLVANPNAKPAASFLEETALLNPRLTVLLPQLSISINANIGESLRTAE